MLPDKDLYDAGQRAVLNGDWIGAIGLFEGYLRAHPELRAFQLQMVYQSLAYCSERIGRRADTVTYRAKIQELVRATSLPEDLWKSAQLAEADGRGLDMRRFYARFLLQQDQLGPQWADQGRIAEAYLKIGDSYRIDAERDLPLETPALPLDSKLKRATNGKDEDDPAPVVKQGGGG
jgi:hypothetical protein